jgi:hypothetical protein
MNITATTTLCCVLVSANMASSACILPPGWWRISRPIRVSEMARYTRYGTVFHNSNSPAKVLLMSGRTDNYLSD